MEQLTEHGLVAEVATGAFSFKNKVAPASIKLLWDKLSRFIIDALKQQKGVLVPNLGTFRVGPVLGGSGKKIRPVFALLETRYSGVSQERPKYTVGGRCTVIQPNYGLLATAAGVHRGACQRLLLELVQRLGVHILSGRPIQVLLPGVGRLFTNKAGRVEFTFDTLLREYFELERERVIPEMSMEPPDDAGALEEEPVARVIKGLQQVHLHNPPSILQHDRLPTGASPPSPSSRVKRHAHAPYKGGLLDLWRLCRSNDRINSGCVPRLQLEQMLYKECAGVLSQVAASTVLELLSINTYGKTGRHILYKPFLDQLEGVIGNVTPVELSPRSVQSPRRVVEVRVDSPMAAEKRWHLQQQQLEQQELAAGSEDEAEATFSQGAQRQYPPPPLDVPRTPGFGAPAWQGHPHGQSEGGGSEAPVAHHYYQNHLSPRSRKAYDQFNRVHFEKLEQERGPDYRHRAVTPKVGEDALNRREYYAVRQPDAATPQQVMDIQDAPPYSRGTPQPLAQSIRRRGSPGPQPQIMTLGHPTPSPLAHVPGLPNHYFQPQQPTPSRQPTPQRQPTPSRQPTPQHQEPQSFSAWRPSQQQPQHQQPQSFQAWQPSPPQHQHNQHHQQQRPLSAWQASPQQAPQQDDSPPISQYEIINEADPVLRARKRDELARVLQRGWSEQIREKEQVLQGIAVAESQWPYVATRQPNDKRPPSAVSRPLTGARRSP